MSWGMELKMSYFVISGLLLIYAAIATIGIGLNHIIEGLELTFVLMGSASFITGAFLIVLGAIVTDPKPSSEQA